MPDVVSRIVEVCVFRFSANEPEYLLLKRSPDERVYPGLWQTVSGKVREGEKAIDAARRELSEETRLQPINFWTVPHVSEFYDPGSDTLNLIPFFAAQVDPAAEPVLSSEHQVSQWLPYEDARSQLVWGGQKEGLDVVHRSVLPGDQAGRLTRVR